MESTRESVSVLTMAQCIKIRPGFQGTFAKNMVNCGVTGDAGNNTIAGQARKLRIEEAKISEGAHMNEKITPDETLLGLAKAGDEAAMTTLLERYRMRGVSYCARILGNYYDAEDVWQDVYLSIQSKIAKIRKFAPYLFRCLSTGCCKKLKQRDKEQKLIQSAAASGHVYAVSARTTSASPSSLELEEFQAEAGLVLDIILSRRSDEQVWVLNLRFWREMGLKQIEKNTRRAVSTLSSWCSAFREERETELLKRGLLQGYTR